MAHHFAQRRLSGFSPEPTKAPPFCALRKKGHSSLDREKRKTNCQKKPWTAESTPQSGCSFLVERFSRLRFRRAAILATRLSLVLLPAANTGREPRRFLFVPGSNPGRIPAGHRAVEKVLLLAARNPNKSQVLPVPNWNGSRSPPDRSSWPACMPCNVSG